MSTTPPLTPELTEQPAAAARETFAPAWHTALFLVIVFVFAAVGAREHGTTVARHGRLFTYLLTLGWEWLLVAYVLWGIRKHNRGARDLVGGKWATPEDALMDVAIAVGFWIAAALVLAGISVVLGLTRPDQIEQAKKQIGVLMPQNGLELGVWLALSATAGFCEELLFRGYLMKQFAAWTRSMPIAILLQAIVFGIAHAYQGGARILLIGTYGMMFGLLAWWRGSLRPGMFGHALQDSFSGIMFRFLK